MSSEYAEILARLREVQDKGKPSSAVDPTANVLQLVSASITRLDDLRVAESRHRDAMAELQDRLGREIREAEKKGQNDLSLAESRRIDALLAAQQQTVALASSKADLTAQALAERVDASAKALAASVDATAKSLAAAADITSKTLSERIGPLEQFRYEQAGSREQRSDTRLSIQQVLTIVGIVAGAVYFLASGAGV